MSLLNIIDPSDEEASVRDQVVGIDFGTTNSLLAFTSPDGAINFIEGEGRGSPLIPSIAEIDGIEIHSIKRLIGRGLNDKEAIAGSGLAHLIDYAHQDYLALKIGGKLFSPEEIAALIMTRLKEIAEAEPYSLTISKAVITVPAYFDEVSREAIKTAAKLAGIEAIRLVSEPTAAAIAYGLDNEQEGNYLVYDLGGGTFDISLLKMQQGLFRVIAVSGDSNLGGDDYDWRIAELIDQNLTGEERLSLKITARTLKEAMTHQYSSCGEDSQLLVNYKNRKIQLTYHEISEATKDLTNRTILITKKLLHSNRLKLNGIILAGGATRIPMIENAIRQEFNNIEIFNDLDPDRAVAIGAAIQGDLLGSKYLASENHSLLLDIIPLSLGLETMGGAAMKLIERGSTIPISKTQEFTTHQDGQGGISFHIVQGEREMAKDCRSLAYFELKNIPPMPAGEVRVSVTFAVDVDGLVSVSAKETTTQISCTTNIRPSYGLSPEKVKTMVEDALAVAKSDISLKLMSEIRPQITRRLAVTREIVARYEDSEHHKDILGQIASVSIDLEKIAGDVEYNDSVQATIMLDRLKELVSAL